MEAPTDEQLVEAVKEGDIAPFEILVRRYQDKLLPSVLKIVKEPAVAEEVVQDALFAVYKTIGRIDTTKKFSSYVFTIARNMAISRLRSARPAEKLNEDFLAVEDEEVVDTLVVQDQKEKLRKFVTQLDEKYRQVIDLYYFQELQYEEIARKLKLPVNTVRTRLRRAKQQLADFYE